MTDLYAAARRLVAGPVRLAAGLALCLIPAAGWAEDWSYRVTPYLWLPELTTQLDIGTNPPVESGKSLLDVLDGAFLINALARRGPLSFSAEVNYLNLSDDVATASTGSVGEWRLRGIMASAMAGYAIHEAEGTRIEAIAGLRGWALDAQTTVLGVTATADTTWVDPLIGARLETDLTDRLGLLAEANIGGFGVGSDLQWEALAALNWDVSDLIGVGIGYRHLLVDFSDTSNVIDMEMSGPFVSLSFRF